MEFKRFADIFDERHSRRKKKNRAIFSLFIKIKCFGYYYYFFVVVLIIYHIVDVLIWWNETATNSNLLNVSGCIVPIYCVIFSYFFLFRVLIHSSIYQDRLVYILSHVLISRFDFTEFKAKKKEIKKTTASFKNKTPKGNGERLRNELLINNSLKIVAAKTNTTQIKVTAGKRRRRSTYTINHSKIYLK